MKVTVDRIEKNFAVFILNEDEKTKFNLPLKIAPGLKEGDIVELTIEKDEIATKNSKIRVTNLIDKLKKKNIKSG